MTIIEKCILRFAQCKLYGQKNRSILYFVNNSNYNYWGKTLQKQFNWYCSPRWNNIFRTSLSHLVTFPLWPNRFIVKFSLSFQITFKSSVKDCQKFHFNDMLQILNSLDRRWWRVHMYKALFIWKQNNGII